MIRLTRMNRQPVVLNADVIVSVEATPDTLVTLTTGDRLHVLETVDQVVEAALGYQRQVHDPAFRYAPTLATPAGDGA